MSTIKQKANSIALAVSASFLLSACNSLPFMGDDEPEVNNLSSNTTRPSSSYNNSDNDQDLQTEIEDFKSMKPSLSRLVALESDLSFLLEEMSRFNEQNPVVYDTAGSSVSQNPSSSLGSSNQTMGTVTFGVDGKTENTVAQVSGEWAPSQGTMANKWSDNAGERDTLGMNRRQRPSSIKSATTSNSNSNAIPGVNQAKFGGAQMETAKTGNSQVEVGTATPVMQLDSSVTNQAPGPATAGVRPSRFRSANSDVANAATRPTSRAPIPNNLTKSAPVDMRKFSNNPRQIVGDVSSCSEWKSDTQKTYSLHLASYKSRSAAESGWNSLDKKYEDVWCDTQATLAKVVVKGTEYLSLRVGAYDSRDKVLSLCSVIKERGDYCAVSTATGERIQ